MCDSMTKHNFDSISDAVDRVSDAVDNDLEKFDTNNIEQTYDNARDTNTGSTNYDQKMKGAHKDNEIKVNVQNNRYDDTVTQHKWSTETNEVDNQFLRDYDNIHRQMENRQIDEYYKAQRQILVTPKDVPDGYSSLRTSEAEPAADGTVPHAVEMVPEKLSVVL